MQTNKTSIARVIVGVVLLLAPATTWSQGAPEYGPAKGTLLIVGGGSLSEGGIPEKFIELAGGKDAKFVIVPTAGGNKNADGTIKVYN
jgi:cyanophycinase